MMAISVRQPYAGLIVGGVKTVECRSWSTPHRGELLICASMAWVDDVRAALEDGEFDEESWDAFCVAYPRGVAVGTVTLSEVVPFGPQHVDHAAMERAPNVPSWAWLLSEPKPFDPKDCFPVKGKLHLFQVNM